MGRQSRDLPGQQAEETIGTPLHFFQTENGSLLEKMLVVVFDDEPEARDAFRALSQLDAAGDISIRGGCDTKEPRWFPND